MCWRRNSLVLAVLVPASLVAAKCPAGTVTDTSTGDCYLFATKPKPWQQAEDDCVARGGHLASASDANENALLTKLTPTKCTHVYWLGGRIITQSSGGAWKWTDGKPFSYTNWASAQPTSSATICTVYNMLSGQWYSEMCASKKPYICKLPAKTAKAGKPAKAALCTTKTAMPNCETGWSYLTSSGKCYKVLGDNQTWPIHETKCNFLGAHLTSVHDRAENDFIRDLASMGHKMPVCTNTCPAAVWIGLYREAGGAFTGFKWSDGTELGLADYKNWGPLRPYFETFSSKTYVSIYGDPMDTPELWGQWFYGKWDQFKDEYARMRAGVCKRDY